MSVKSNREVMEANTEQVEHGDGEEFVLLDLASVLDHIDIPDNAPYVLSGLDTLNPILTIDGKWKLIGEYEDTVGTCIVFSEETSPLFHEVTGPSEANLFSGARIVDPNHVPAKEVKPIASLQKVLKFKLLLEDDGHTVATQPDNSNVSESNK